MHGNMFFKPIFLYLKKIDERVKDKLIKEIINMLILIKIVINYQGVFLLGI